MNEEDKKVFYKQQVNPCGVSEEEIVHIFNLLDNVSDLPVVEIGVYHGVTTRLMANYLKKIGKPNVVIGIDPFDKFVDEYASSWPTGVGSKEHFMLNIAGFNNIEILEHFSTDQEALDYVTKASLIFLDGDHSYETVKKDLINWVPKAETFIMHDMKYPSVQQAIKDLGLEVENLSYNLGKVK